MTKHYQHNFLNVPCHTCCVATGKTCVTKGGQIAQYVHLTRERESRRLTARERAAEIPRDFTPIKPVPQNYPRVVTIQAVFGPEVKTGVIQELVSEALNALKEDASAAECTGSTFVTNTEAECWDILREKQWEGE